MLCGENLQLSPYSTVKMTATQRNQLLWNYSQGLGFLRWTFVKKPQIYNQKRRL
jgi:hypothetical protein